MQLAGQGRTGQYPRARQGRTPLEKGGRTPLGCEGHELDSAVLEMPLHVVVVMLQIHLAVPASGVRHFARGGQFAGPAIDLMERHRKD